MIAVDAPRPADPLHTADPLCLDAARRAGDARYDPDLDLLLSPAKPNPIHTRIVTGSAHPPRESLSYALALLELDRAGDRSIDGESRAARAARVIGAVLALQDTDPTSDTYGLWPYWAEEPLAEMSPPDWNWADFHGEVLSLILLRHADLLDADARERTRAGLGHAARSIIRRDVDLDYTNIAVKGTFVTLAAGALLGDPAFEEYGRERLRRLHARLTAVGSFAEFNSPTYWHVVMQALTATRQYFDDPGITPLAADLERLAWQHFLARWHPATGQLTGPMARCYETDLRGTPGVLLVLQRVAPETWTRLTADTLAPNVHVAPDAVIDYRIPDDLRPLLDEVAPPATGHETFSDTHYIDGQVAGISAAAAAGIPSLVLPTTGTSWRDGALTLGTVNFGDTWLQRRPLLGFWAEPGDDPLDPATPARHVGVEVLRDGHGFAGGSFSAAQNGGDVLWAVSLATPSGDAHIHLDAIAAGEAVPTRELLVRFWIRGVDPAAVRVDGIAPGAPSSFDRARRVEVRTAGVWIEWSLADARFDGQERTARVRVGDSGIEIEVLWLGVDAPRALVVDALDTTLAAGRLRMAAEPQEDAATTASLSSDAVELATAGLRLIAPVLPGSRLEHARIARRNLSR
ncbi:hypothetical protein IF188_10215 [Microbacterium sp. NEAU-LLC]|uniref:Heparinase II/III-like protein n=1 Tax=Microbacterium helvum TaxID=2773713 RepID=A0ABR8NN36_9MICO|nr:hypothetical protein [Microbacterium helvum]MBD3942070.1 hypothetical protein [Microbacterium helvum]